MDENGTLHWYNTQEDIVRVINSQIGSKCHLGLHSSAGVSQILEDLGQFGENAAVQTILDGTYILPPDTDSAVIAIMHEAAQLHADWKVCQLQSLMLLLRSISIFGNWLGKILFHWILDATSLIRLLLAMMLTLLVFMWSP